MSKTDDSLDAYNKTLEEYIVLFPEEDREGLRMQFRLAECIAQAEMLKYVHSKYDKVIPMTFFLVEIDALIKEADSLKP